MGNCGTLILKGAVVEEEKEEVGTNRNKQWINQCFKYILNEIMNSGRT